MINFWSNGPEVVKEEKLVKIVKNILLYILSIYFVLQGAFGVSYSIGASICFWVCAILTFPFMHTLFAKVLESKNKSAIKWWIYVILVIVFYIVGMILWPTGDNASENKPQDNKVVSDSDSSDSNSEDTKNEQTEVSVDLSDIDATITDEVKEDIVDDGIVTKLVEFGFTEDEAYEMRKLFIMCGVSSIDECAPTDPNATIDGVASFRAEWDKDRTFWFTVDHREVFYMSLNGTDVYDKDQGGFLINVNDVHVPESTMTVTQKEELRDLTEKVLDKYFKHAPYYDAWGMARSDDDYMVQCEAYASNDLGVKKYVPARVWYTKSGEEYIVTGVSIDGVQYEVK